jgi:hypothetical protein
MALRDTDQNNFTTLKDAFSRDDVALLECKDAKTGEYVPVICAVHMEGEEYIFTPFAKMFVNDPYEELKPPMENDDGSPIQNIPPSRT